MTEYISREAAIKSTWMILEGMGYPRSENRSLERTVESVFKSAPAADVVEVRHSHWNEEGLSLVCADCGWMQYHDIPYGYCPNCGAKMDGGHDE